MKLTSLQKVKLILGANFIVIFVLVLSIPFFIQGGTRWVSEEATEAFFIALGLIAIIYIFRHYDYLMQKREEQAFLLDVKLKNRERELLDAFQHLGKVNVQFSMIKDLLEKTEMPSTKNELKKAYGEILSLACSITKSPCALMKIVDLEQGRILHENFHSIDAEYNQSCVDGVGSAKMIENAVAGKQNFTIGSTFIFTSGTENFRIKAFISVPAKKQGEVDYSKEEKEFLEAIANQCEIIFLLFSSEYYRNKK